MQEVTQEKTQAQNQMPEGVLANDYTQIEDVAMKTAAQFWAEELLGWVGVKEKVRCIAPTESVHLEMRRMYEDFNYVMEDGSWYHLEFESDRISLADLKRFREYEAVTSRNFQVAVTTCVICSSNVKKLNSEFTEGLNTYRVKVIRMKDEDAEEIFKQFESRNGQKRTKKEYIPIILSPLMCGKMPQKERILNGIKILQQADEMLEEDAKKMQAVLYSFANKFLTDKDLKDVKEAVALTKLGQMIFDDGVEKGIEKGREQGIQGMVETCAELKCTKEVILAKLQEKFCLSQEEAQDYLGKYWKYHM